jgi:GAF domain-containing protein
MNLESSPGELVTVFAGLHGMFLSEQDATAAVQQLARAARQMVPAATGAGVSLMSDDGTRLSTAATDKTVEAADTLQYALGQGPCLSAWATGDSQRVEDTHQDPRWVRWQQAAAQAGIRSVLSVPLAYRDHRLGALKVYATRPGAFGDPEERVLRLLADAAATLLGAAQPVQAPRRLSGALQSALRSRETIALATGVLMSRDHLGAEAARSRLLEWSRSQGRPVVEVAAEVLDGDSATGMAGFGDADGP